MKNSDTKVKVGKVRTDTQKIIKDGNRETCTISTNKDLEKVKEGNKVHYHTVKTRDDIDTGQRNTANIKN